MVCKYYSQKDRKCLSATNIRSVGGHRWRDLPIAMGMNARLSSDNKGTNCGSGQRWYPFISVVSNMGVCPNAKGREVGHTDRKQDLIFPVRGRNNILIFYIYFIQATI